MSTGDPHISTALPPGPLQEAHRAAAAGRFHEALALAERARTEHPSNLHVLAYLKQLERLHLVGVHPVRPPAAIDDILRSLEAIARNSDTGTRQTEPDPAERRAAIERLKERYFIEADLFRARGDHARAIEEIRRVFILDPADVRARAYESNLLSRTAEASAAPTREHRELESYLVKQSPFPPAEFRPVDGTEPAAETPRDIPRRRRREPRRVNLLLPLALAVAAAAAIMTLILPGAGDPSPDIRTREVEPAGANPGLLPPYGGDTPEIRIALPRGEDRSPAGGAAGGEAARAKEKSDGPVASKPSREASRFAKAAAVPRLLVLSPPVLPDRLKSAKGMVRVRVQVGPDGRPLQAKVVDSTNPLFNSAVIEAALSSQFEPARSASGPVTAWVTVPISFGK